MNVVKRSLEGGYEIVRVDNLNNYYNKQIKFWRLKHLINGKGKIKEENIKRGLSCIM